MTPPSDTSPLARRNFLKTMFAGSLALPLGGFAAPDAATGSPAAPGASDALDSLLPDFNGMSPEQKIRDIEKLTSTARHHPSGIMVCMPYVAPDGLRQVRLTDFKGQDKFSDNFGHRFKSVTDFFSNENSITTSGSHLAAQSIRFKATEDPDALAAARVAYRSLRTVFQFGVEAGVPGFMGKPFHFEYSAHTTGDQYLHTLWGLWSFHPIASPEEQAEVSSMLVAMADYQMKVDYTIFNRTGGSWNNRLDPTDYNAIMAAIVAAAYKMTGDQKYRDACEFVMQTGKWQTHRRIDYIIEQFQNGTYEPKLWDKIAGALIEDREFAHWEQIQHCQFTAISAVIIHESVPELFSREDLSRVLALWWADYPVGFDPVNWNYLYWFIISTEDRSWRAVEMTQRLPREQWMGGHPMLSFASKWVYGDCLARFQWTAMVVARHCPEKRAEAVRFASNTLRFLQPRHLLWISDPDGHQVPPSLNYFTHFLSSEVPECMIASYWEGRRLNLWA